MVYMQDRGFNSFASNMIKLWVNETKWSSLLARILALILYISMSIFDVGPEKLPGLSRNGPQVHIFPPFRSVCTNLPLRLPVALFLFDFWLACLLLSVNQSDRCSLIIKKQVLLVIASFGNCHFSSHRFRPNYGLGRKSHWGAFCGEWSSGWRVHA